MMRAEILTSFFEARLTDGKFIYIVADVAKIERLTAA